jgi:hypothetical protein
MKRVGWKIAALLILAVLVFVWLIRVPILNSALSNRLGVSVSARWIGLWPTYTKLHLFKVENPPGFQGSAFEAKEIVCRYSLRELFGDPTVIDRIEINHSVLRIDFTDPLSVANNWTALGKSLPQHKSDAKVLIRKLTLADFNVEIVGANYLVKPKQTHFDALEFDDISSQEGFPTARLVRLIFQTSGLGEYIENLFNPEIDLEEALTPLRMLGI